MGADRYSSRSKKNKSKLYFFLSIVLVIVLAKWGVPFFVNLIAGPTESKGGLMAGEDTVPPQMPVLSALPEATNSAQLTVGGYSEAKVEISVWRNGNVVASGQSDDQGNFRIDIRLTDGENTINVRATDEKGNESESAVKKVVFDNSEIVISIETPTDGGEIFGKTNQNLTVSGVVSRVEANVSVNGSFARVDANGNFSVVIRLNEGDNEIVIKAVDKAGNTAERRIRVKLIF